VILLVEDEAQIAIVANAMLKQLQFTVIEASNGKEVLELYHQISTLQTLCLS
jgi:CheY-like chemotaxis protein